MMPPNISMVIADDHPIMLNGLQQEIEAYGFNIVGTATNGMKALELILDLQPDIALLDIEMPILNGFEVVKRAIEQHIKTKYVMMTYHKQKSFVVQAKSAGVHGYLLKEDSIKEIILCIQSVLDDQLYYSSSFEQGFEKVVEKEFKKLNLLSPSERTIIRLVAQNKSSAEIGKQLLISTRTVEKHRTNIIAKLELTSSIDALNQWVQEYRELVSTL